MLLNSGMTTLWCSAAAGPAIRCDLCRKRVAELEDMRRLLCRLCARRYGSGIEMHEAANAAEMRSDW